MINSDDVDVVEVEAPEDAKRFEAIFHSLNATTSFSDLVSAFTWTSVDVVWAKSLVLASYGLEISTLALLVLSTVVSLVISHRGGGSAPLFISLACSLWCLADLSYMARGYGHPLLTAHPFIPDLFFGLTAVVYGLYLASSSETRCAVRGLLGLPRELTHDDPAEVLALSLSRPNDGPSSPFWSSERVIPVNQNDVIVLSDVVGTVSWIVYDASWYHMWQVPSLAGVCVCLAAQFAACCAAEGERELRFSYVATFFWVIADALWMMHDFKHFFGRWSLVWISFAISFLFLLAASLGGYLGGVSLSGIFGKIRKHEARARAKQALRKAKNRAIHAIRNPDLLHAILGDDEQ
jgi:hypothetical protein